MSGRVYSFGPKLKEPVIASRSFMPEERDCPTCGGPALFALGEYDSIAGADETPGEVAGLSFEGALGHLRAGRTVRRSAWVAGSVLVLCGQRIEHVARRYGGSSRSTWIATHAALLANDWEVV